MSAKIPAFTDIGKSARDVLLGGKDGVFQYNQLVTISSKTSDGVEFTASTVRKGEAVETAVKAGYKHNNVTGIATVNHLGKLTASAAFNDIAPGLSATLAGTLPDQDLNSLKLNVDYYLPHITAKALVALNSTPTINASISTGYNDFVLGTNFTYDHTKNSPISNWTAGLGYTRLDYQVAALVADSGETLKVTGAHNIDPKHSLAAEIARSLSKDDSATLITVGYQKLLDGGGLTKYRLDNQGILHALYETDLSKGTRLTVSGQFDAKDFQKSPKFGFAVDVKN